MDRRPTQEPEGPVGSSEEFWDLVARGRRAAGTEAPPRERAGRQVSLLELLPRGRRGWRHASELARNARRAA